MSRILLATLCAVALTSAPALAKPKHCPPGLAKKSPACVPPGQVGKSVSRDDDSDRDDDHDRWTDDRHDSDDDWYGDRYDRIHVGDRVVLEGQDYTVIRVGDDRVVLRRDDRDYTLPRRGDGSEYVRMGDVLVRVDPETRDVINWIRLTDLIFG